MLTDVPGYVISHGSRFIFTVDRGKIHCISVRVGRIIAQEGPVARHYIEASPFDIIVVRISTACPVGIQLLPAVFVHSGNAVLIVVPGLSLAAQSKLPYEIRVVHEIEEPQRFFLMRAVG